LRQPGFHVFHGKHGNNIERFSKVFHFVINFISQQDDRRNTV
jgi:hypothetical protein